MSDHITICVCTYRRTALLARLLRNLALQETRGLFTVSVVVVENDPAGPSRQETARVAAETGLEVVYSVEPEKGIPVARNHALRLAQGSYIGIIDDDEFPPPQWLAVLYDTIRTFDVDGALGPVVPFFEQAPPPWLLKSGLYDWPYLRTGTTLHWQQTRTSNVLIKREVFESSGLHFNTAFKTGGSDKDFFHRAMAAGFRFVAAAEAPVYEVIPPERWSMGYFVRRALVNGFNASRYVIGEGKPLKSLAAFAKSALAFAVAVASLPLSAVLGPHVLAGRLESGAYHLSRLAATLGIELWKKRDF